MANKCEQNLNANVVDSNSSDNDDIENQAGSDSEDDTDEGSNNETDDSEYVDSTVGNCQPLHDHVEEVTTILSENLEVNPENALRINKAMQAKLLKVREIFEELLRKCEMKYATNSQFLENSEEVHARLKNYRICGAPYFKDLDHYLSPPNADYKRRTLEDQEVFLMDLREIPIRYWTLNDKKNLVNGVKSQVINYLQAKNLPNNSQEKNELENIRLAVLLKKVDSNFQIDWESISKINLADRHLDINCYAMWHGYLSPELEHGKWTEEENERLIALAEQYRFQNWSLISREIPGRSEFQCFVQFQFTVSRHLEANRTWTAYEDEQLVNAVKFETVGAVINWSNVKSYFVNRSKKDIYERYNTKLNPTIKKGPFTREEDCILLAAIEEYGEKFSMLPMSLFPNRTRKQVKNRYLNSIRYADIKRGWTVEDDEKLIDFVKKNGTKKWTEISNILKVHPRASCRTRYGVIENFFKKNPKATAKDLPRKNRRIISDISKDNWVEKIYELKTVGDVKAKEREERKKALQLKTEAGTYRGKLRAITRRFYELFKYSFDYKFMKPVKIHGVMHETVPFYCNALNFNLNRNAIQRARRKFESDEYDFLRDLNTHVEPNNKSKKATKQIPVNWSTILGLRALIILANSQSYLKVAQQTKLKPSKNVEAEIQFKQRFAVLFSKHALFTKINPKVIDSIKCTIESNTKKNGQTPAKLDTPSTSNKRKASASANVSTGSVKKIKL